MNAGAPTDGATRTGVYGHDDLPPGTVLGGRFRIEALLGVGGMGVVYRATDLTLDVQVALKLLRPELAQRGDAFERFRQELLLSRQVSSARVVRIHDLARYDERWLISMDFVDGETLDRRIDRDGPLPLDAATAIARQIAEGLGAAHAKGVIHRDLKPANILIDRAGDAYIGDFGVARSLAAAGATRAGAVIGTPDYLSPEQARGGDADARSDLYALGLILHEMLTGALPFPGGTLPEVLAQRMLRAPEPVRGRRPDTPPWLARLIDRLLRAQPAHRLQRAEAVIDAIDRRALERDFRPGAALRRRGAWVAAAAALALAGGGAVWWWSRPPAPAPAAATATAVAAPLDRVLVLPVSGSGDAARDAALAAHLRDGLALVPGIAVVDGERTRQAMLTVDPGGQAAPDPSALRRAAAAQRVLQPRLRQVGGQWRLRAHVGAADGGSVALDGPPADDPAQALAAWMRAPGVARALGAGAPAGAVPDPALPGSLAALDRYGAGLLARQDGRLDEALRQYAAATAAAPGYVGAWWAQTQVALDVGARDRAADAVVQGQRAAERGAAPGWRARLAAQRAVVDGDTVAAVAQWRAIADAAGDDTSAALHLARARAADGDFDGAAEALRRLVERDPDDPRIWFERGKLSILRGDARTAVDDHLVRALVAFKRGRDLYGESETVNALGVGYGRLGQTADAAEQYRKAIELRRRLGNRRGEATSLRNLANVLSLTGDFDGADRTLRQARALNIALGDRQGHAAIDNELGLLAEERGDHRGALEAFRRALQVWREADDAHGAAEALNSIGFAHYQLGNYEDAEVYWRQAGDGYAALGEHTGQVRTQQNLGLLATARGRWKQAREQLQASLAQSERRQMLEEAAVSRRNLAELELQQGRLRAAIEHAGLAEAAFRQRDDLRGRSDAGLLRAEAWLAAGDDARAAQALEALSPSLAAASGEQRAIAEWLRAALAARAGDGVARARHLQNARRLAAASGVRHLQLRIELLAARAEPARLAGLDRPTAELGHAGLRLDWLEQTMQRALAAGDAKAAASAYDQAASLLRAGEFVRADVLHRLGAQARALAGDAAGARAALARADEAAIALRKGAPAAATRTAAGAGSVGKTP